MPGRIKSVGLASFAAFAVMAVAGVANASAALPCPTPTAPYTDWTDNGSVITTAESATTQIPSLDCNGTTQPGLQLTDSNTPLGSITVTCPPGSITSSSGTVGPNGSDTVTAATASNCTSNDTTGIGCANPVTAMAVNLPWDTKLDSMFPNDDITNSGNDVGWGVWCGGIPTTDPPTDKCTATSSAQALTYPVPNGPTPSAVDSTFEPTDSNGNPVTPPADCTVGGPGAGTVTGTVQITLTNRDNLGVE